MLPFRLSLVRVKVPVAQNGKKTAAEAVATGVLQNRLFCRKRKEMHPRCLRISCTVNTGK